MEATLPDLIAKAEKVSGLKPTVEQNHHCVINSKKVTDHHAIIPTASVDKANLSELPSGEREVLRLIATRLLEVERESYSSEQFMGEIEDMVRDLVDTYEIVPDAEVLMKPAYAPLGKCPHCGRKGFCHVSRKKEKE